MVVEAAINLWLANTLIQEGLVLEYRAIIVMLIMPSVVNPLVWLGLKSHYKISGYVKVFEPFEQLCQFQVYALYITKNMHLIFF